MAVNAHRLCLLLCGGLLLLLAGCAGKQVTDAAPPTRLDPAQIQDAVPRPEPVIPAGNKSPYTVLGQTYEVLPSSRGFSETGTASWYGTKFHGHKTSNGETYSMYGMTGAHRTLPIPSYVKVTNLDNGRTAVVRINDRGPFKSQRIMDVSYAAATKLGFIDKGTARVRIDAIDTAHGRAPAALAAAPSAPPSNGGINPAVLGGRYLQVGAFREELSATRLRDELDRMFEVAVFVQPFTAESLFRVRIGPFFNGDDLLKVQQMLEAGGYGRALIVKD